MKKVRKSFLFDQDFCIGCKACEVACQTYHKQEPEINWRKVDEYEVVQNGNIKSLFLTHSCNHCENPICAEVCPAEAYTVREDGIVELNRDKCIGCGYCAQSCEYNAITLLGQENKAQKCNMCAERLDRGELPACVTACPMGVLSIIETDLANRAGMEKEVVGFKANSYVPSTRFYPKFVTGMKRKEFTLKI
ncbi:ubiquinol cytochrome C oxidoreductase [Malaciobacter halophilus]|uniref:Ubiquinol cytochrome C oxidoreductase n=1 Tax=Malaciobacter halophilus TaxID=197482 RepID=A0A2N1J1Q4_9BACT|nr:4Fe-4S dicluster domain-containing protein [Malaciobacter halophilus]AXH08587.1 anaerobic reductase, iron-sulfur binding domain-containing protein [Malaciobacter halophilus]PKI80434.1 ubiquinol cytochrome C oxidoreductase [Malaciobacter halophilus]